MKNKNILCCINDEPFCSYHSLNNEKQEGIELRMINFITEKSLKKNWITKETTYEKDIEVIYYEVNVEKAFLMIKNKRKIKGKTEQFCLSFLNYFLQTSPEPLIRFLKNTKIYGKKDLEDIRKHFNQK